MTVVVASRRDLDLDAYRRVAWRGEPVRFAPAALARMAECRTAFLDLLESDATLTVYGVTSGYGQEARRRLDAEGRRRHAARPPLAPAAGFGAPLPERVTRGIVFARLANYVEGHAAITPALAGEVAAMLGGGPLPEVPSEGVTCAGEIAVLSHLLGDVARRVPLAEKDALALVNGSPCAAALVSDAALAARARLDLATEVFALAADAFDAPRDAYDGALAGLWGDPHEADALERLRTLLAHGAEGRRPYQAPVSFRVVPRLLGRAGRCAAQAAEVAARCLCAVTDNPVYLAPDDAHPRGRVLSNGGFHDAKSVAALDALAAAWADLALLADRQATKLLDGHVSRLPDNLRIGEGYLGCLGFTAAARAEQARRAAQPSLLAGSEGGGFGQNDVASPGVDAWRAERDCGRCLDATLAVLAAVASQAFAVTGRMPAPALAAPLETVRAAFPPLDSQRPPGPDAAALAERFGQRVYAP